MANIRITEMNSSADLIPLFDELARLMSAIEHRAYQRFEERGYQHGADLDDWIEAERQVLGTPAADEACLPDSYTLRIALSGFEKSEIAILAAPGDLVLRAETNGSQRNDDCRMHLKVMRRFALPPGVKLSAATAQLQRGLLTIQAPRIAHDPA